MMQFQVTNESLKVDCVNITALTGGSLFKIGDTESIQSYAATDTPPGAMIVIPDIVASGEAVAVAPSTHGGH